MIGWAKVGMLGLLRRGQSSQVVVVRRCPAVVILLEGIGEPGKIHPPLLENYGRLGRLRSYSAQTGSTLAARTPRGHAPLMSGCGDLFPSPRSPSSAILW